MESICQFIDKTEKEANRAATDRYFQYEHISVDFTSPDEPTALLSLASQGVARRTAGEGRSASDLDTFGRATRQWAIRRRGPDPAEFNESQTLGR